MCIVMVVVGGLRKGKIMWTISKQRDKFAKCLLCVLPSAGLVKMWVVDLMCKAITSCPNTKERTIGNLRLLRARTGGRENNNMARSRRKDIIANLESGEGFKEEVGLEQGGI